MRLNKEIEALQTFLRDPAHKVGQEDSAYVHRQAMERIWQHGLKLAGGNAADALEICKKAVLSGKQQSESQADYVARLDGIPGNVFITNPSQPRVDHVQHFFAVAQLAFLSSLDPKTNPGTGGMMAKGLGRLYELKDLFQEWLGQKSGGYDKTDILADDRGAEFGTAIALAVRTGEDEASVSIEEFFYGGNDGPDAGVDTPPTDSPDAGVAEESQPPGDRDAANNDQDLQSQVPHVPPDSSTFVGDDISLISLGPESNGQDGYAESLNQLTTPQDANASDQSGNSVYVDPSSINAPSSSDNISQMPTDSDSPNQYPDDSTSAATGGQTPASSSEPIGESDSTPANANFQSAEGFAQHVDPDSTSIDSTSPDSEQSVGNSEGGNQGAGTYGPPANDTETSVPAASSQSPQEDVDISQQ
jgi:hypothetical protein